MSDEIRMMKGTLICTAFMAIGFLLGCGGVEKASTIAGDYSLFARGYGEETASTKPVRMEIKSDSDMRFQGRKGSIQRVGQRYKLTFSGINSETFKAAGLGNNEGNNVTFWLEFTDAGNCIMYSRNQASFFLRKEFE